tara:strand:- start:605 stop:817 length:213 start_codon:yes stop_codon:yes gene_type:complete
MNLIKRSAFLVLFFSLIGMVQFIAETPIIIDQAMAENATTTEAQTNEGRNASDAAQEEPMHTIFFSSGSS